MPPAVSLGASGGGLFLAMGQGGLEAASGVHMGGGALTVDDDAMVGGDGHRGVERGVNASLTYQ